MTNYITLGLYAFVIAMFCILGARCAFLKTQVKNRNLQIALLENNIKEQNASILKWHTQSINFENKLKETNIMAKHFYDKSIKDTKEWKTNHIHTCEEAAQFALTKAKEIQ